ETLSVTEEIEIFIPDTKVSFDLNCPELLITGETGICNVTILRGTDLQVRLNFGNDDEEDFVVPDATVVPVGFPVPYLLPPNSSGDSQPPEIVYVSVGELPFSILIGYDFLARDAGSFNVQVLAPKCNDGEKFCGKCDNSCPEKGTSVCAEETESFCSFTKTCVDSQDDTPCMGSLHESDFTEIRSFSVEAKESGYNYHPLEESDYTESALLSQRRDMTVMYAAVGSERFALRGKETGWNRCGKQKARTQTHNPSSSNCGVTYTMDGTQCQPSNY
ncbi:hypothetical protein AVEN_22521-1, partial [Araneus ventricosus]